MTSTLVGVTHAIRTALAAQITAGGVNCLPYDTWTRQMGNGATLSANTTRGFAVYNGHARLRTLSIAVLIYTLVAGDTKASLQLGEELVESAIAAIAADTSLRHMVSEAMFEGDTSVELYRDDNGQMVQIHEIPLRLSLLATAA